MYDHDPMGRINIPALRFFMTLARVLVGAALVLIVVGITALFVLDLEGSFTARLAVGGQAVILLLGGAAALALSRSKLTELR
ncbi:hypothetical protein HJ581_0041720 [Rhodococcus opacus]|nr:hypothetical protein HJ581_0041720 [Rhodococcus opacus]